jgi:hypothetical protein
MTNLNLATKVARTAIATLLAAASFSVMAGPIVTEWGYQIDSGFTAFTPGSVTGSNINAVVNAPSQLNWGTDVGNGLSSLSVGAATNGNFSGTLNTNAGAVPTVQVIHDNNSIGLDGGVLSTATLFDVLRINRNLPAPAGPDIVINLSFNILFAETINQPACVIASSPTPCNDIFVVDVAGAGFNPANNTLNQPFVYDGNAYSASIAITGLGTAVGCRLCGRRRRRGLHRLHHHRRPGQSFPGFAGHQPHPAQRHAGTRLARPRWPGHARSGPVAPPSHRRQAGGQSLNKCLARARPDGRVATQPARGPRSGPLFLLDAPPSRQGTRRMGTPDACLADLGTPDACPADLGTADARLADLGMPDARLATCPATRPRARPESPFSARPGPMSA